MNTTPTTTNSRKLLVPLATLLVAGAVAVGSGATWTAESGSAVTATAGDLVHLNSEDGATLAVTNLKPGAEETGSLTITNDGSLDSTLALRPSGNQDGFAAGDVTLTVRAVHGTDSALIYTGDFAGLTTDRAVGTLDADTQAADAITVEFTVAMAGDAAETNQGKSAALDLEFVTTQTSADESDANWLS